MPTGWKRSEGEQLFVKKPELSVLAINEVTAEWVDFIDILLSFKENGTSIHQKAKTTSYKSGPTLKEE